MNMLKKGDTGAEVRELQKLLVENGYPVAIDGGFGTKTRNAVRAFQSQNLDQHGHPLVVDGKVGPLTWWSLRNRKPDIDVYSVVRFDRMPPAELGGSAAGRAALKIAIAELKADAREIGGNNKGPFVKKYLAGAGLPVGNPWCASFVSWCFLQSVDGEKADMPFQYTAGARALRKQFVPKGWTFTASERLPEPGDLVFWWRVRADGWQGHVGLVHQLKDGMLYTIEGNKSPRVQGFSYVLSRMDKLLGFGRVVST
jgi:hypothetical protein